MIKFLFIIATLSLAFSAAYATKEIAIAKTHKDPSLKWGPCPELFPKGCEISVLQGDPTKPQADIFLKIPANYQIPSHTHTSPEHMTLVNGEMKIHYEGQDPVTAITGTYLYGPAKAPHKAKCVGNEECVLFISFDAKIDAIKSKDF